MEVLPKQSSAQGPAQWFTGDVWIDAIARGEETVVIRSGDIIHTPSGEEHWHGAAPDHFTTHLSMTEGAAAWGTHVTEAEYLGQS